MRMTSLPTATLMRPAILLGHVVGWIEREAAFNFGKLGFDLKGSSNSDQGLQLAIGGTL